MISGVMSAFSFMQLFSLYDLYNSWENVGVFDFFLPMLLIFAVIFGILISTKVLGDNRGISFIIAIAIALMAMRLSIVSQFFTLVFPGLGIGIAVLIVVLIMAGLFMSNANYRTWLPTFFWGGIVIGLIIVIAVLNDFAWFGSYWWQANWVSVIWIVIVGVILLPLLLPKDTDKEFAAKEARHQLPMKHIRQDSP
ncbi:MAG: hypothetical protein Q8P57_01300 [Candidatus Pacearchaeota archaeon]|nr:hypothetical protein [Candidatus Pacearchaeota archaeon]MDZ4228605.1 hypothetical protein [Candidatus Levybacteria bacterium]